jgi:hypothetical protein
MTLDEAHADHLLRALTGQLRSRQALGELVQRLDSTEEFLAWLLVTEQVLAAEPELVAQLRTLAKAQHVAPATRREASDYPLAREDSRRRLSAELTALLEAHCPPGNPEDSLHAERVRYALAVPVGEAPMRDLLAIRPVSAPR